MPPPPSGHRLVVALGAVVLAGCGTTRMTDTGRAASEMLLISQAVDQAVAKIDFSPLDGQTVFLDASAVDKDVVDRGYLVSVVRQQLLAHGALLQEDRPKAAYVVEVRAGGIGTDRHGLLVGTPSVSLPAIVPGVPGANIPEIALIKKSDQRGVAKLGVFAYNRQTGRALWQSGTVEAVSRAQDTWVFGAGPYSRGTIRKHAELAGEPLPTFPLTLFKQPEKDDPRTGPTDEHFFPAGAAVPGPPPVPFGLLGVAGAAAVGDRPVVR
ncbi:MAG: hypothetical protein K2X82_00830 [Gemmataceae bacterium]|nr:hypothetical protein [Gemmataceae bacterium]